MAKKTSTGFFRGLKRALFALAAFVLTLAVLLAGAFSVRLRIAEKVASVLTLPMSLEKSDVLFVMGGFADVRVPFAVELWDQGYGRELWCATGATTGRQRDFFRKFGVRLDEQSLVEQALKNSGIPRERWKVLPGSINSYTDLLSLKKELALGGVHSVLIVSTPYHFRRIRFILRKVFGPGSGVTFRYAYPPASELNESMTYPDKLVEAVFVELAKNIIYRAKYGL